MNNRENVSLSKFASEARQPVLFENSFHSLKRIPVSPGLLVAHVVDYHQDEDGRHECTRAADGRVKHLTAGGGARRGDHDLLGPGRGVALVLQADLLPLELEAGGVSPRQRDVYADGEVDLRVVGPAVQRQGPRLQTADGHLARLRDVQGTAQRRGIIAVDGERVR